MGRATSLYRKVHGRLYRSERFRRLKLAERYITLCLLTTDQTNSAGLYYLSVVKEAEGIMPVQQFRNGIETVCKTFGWKYDAAASVVYFPSWFKYNPPMNPNQIQGMFAQLLDLPQTPLLQEFIANQEHLSDAAKQWFVQLLPNRLQTVPQRYVNTDTDTDTNTCMNTYTGDADASCPCVEIFDFWNSQEQRPKLRGAASDGHKIKLRARWKDAEFREHWRESIEALGKVPFYNGGGSRDWWADFKWWAKNSENWRKAWDESRDKADRPADAGTVNMDGAQTHDERIRDNIATWRKSAKYKELLADWSDKEILAAYEPLVYGGPKLAAYLEQREKQER